MQSYRIQSIKGEQGTNTTIIMTLKEILKMYFEKKNQRDFIEQQRKIIKSYNFSPTTTNYFEQQKNDKDKNSGQFANNK